MRDEFSRANCDSLTLRRLSSPSLFCLSDVHLGRSPPSLFSYFCVSKGKGCIHPAHTTATIHSRTSSRDPSLNIPLRALPLDYQVSSSSPRFAVTLDPADEGKGSQPLSLSSARSSDSDLSARFRAGDLGDSNIYTGEGSLRTPLRAGHKASGVRAETLRRRAHHSQHYSDIDKEAIEIPLPCHRHISGAERLLASVMSPGNRHGAQMHGLVGKPLL